MSCKVLRRAAKIEAISLTIPTRLLEYLSGMVRQRVEVLEEQFKRLQSATIRELKWPRVGGLEGDRNANLSVARVGTILAGYWSNITV